MQLELRPSTAIVPPPAIAFGLPETGIRGSATSMGTLIWSEATVSRSPHQGCDDWCTTRASGLGRFLSVDPALNLKLAMSNPQAWNRYSYVANNPMNRIDPTGLDWFHVGNTWEWHKGHEYKKLHGYQYLMVATSTGKTNKAGATMFNVKLYDQKNVMFSGTAWSGGNGHPRIPAHNYNLFGSRHEPAPTSVASPPSSVWGGNPPPSYGIQQMPAHIGAWPEQTSYGPIRARLNPTMPVDTSIDGAYYHGQDPINGTFQFGSTHGCLCYGNDTSIIQYIFDHKIDVHVAIDVPVQEP